MCTLKKMNGRVVQVNISPGGIPKRPIPEGLLESRGFQGDSWAHPQFHGGPKQAVLLIALETIQALAARGYPVYPGALGENLTTEGLDPQWWRAGQQYRIGSAMIELTKVRTPCRTLDVFGHDREKVKIQNAIYDAAVKRGDTNSPLWAKSGFYARVIQPGTVIPGDTIALESDLA